MDWSRINYTSSRSMRAFSTSVILVLVVSGCTVGRFIAWNFADIKDYKKFPAAVLQAPENSFAFIDVVRPKQELILPDSLQVGKKHQWMSFDMGLAASSTVYFAVIKSDSLLYEQWFNGYDESSTVTSFSVAKSFVSALVGFAIDEGAIESVQDPIGKYLPDMKDEKMRQVTIEQVLNMASGTDFNESYYSPFSDAAKFYYGRHLEKNTLKMKRASQPGQAFEYRSGNTVILALIVERATGKTLQAYMTEKIWKPLGMERDGSLSLDDKNNRQAKAFAGLNGHPRDFGRFGRLYLKKGEWDGQQLLAEQWISRSVKSATNDSLHVYSYQWWLEPKYIALKDTSAYDVYQVGPSPFRTEAHEVDYAMVPADDFMARGHLGQYIYVNPKKNMIMLRFGKKTGEVYWQGLFREIAKLN